MMDQEPTFWRLDARLGWKTAASPGIAIGSQDGLRLEAARTNDVPSGPLSLDWLDGSLGGTILPHGMAQGEDGRLYLVSPEEGLIKRYEPEQRGFIRLPSIGARKDPITHKFITDNRTLQHPIALAISKRLLYVVDNVAERVQVFSIDAPYLLVYLWSLPDWKPIDVASWKDVVYVLDARGKVYRQRPDSDHLRLWIDNLGQGDWTRIAVDREGLIYLLNSSTHLVNRYDRRGKPMLWKDKKEEWEEEGPLSDSGDIRDNFDPPTIRLSYKGLKDDPWSGRFCVPEGLVWCGGTTSTGIAPESPLGQCLPDTTTRDPDAYLLKIEDVRDVARLADRLRHPRDAAAHAIRDGLGENTRRALSDWLPGLPVTSDLEMALLDELNQLVKGPNLSSEAAFATEQLPDSAKTLLTQPRLDESSTARLNRSLIEAAFPLELRRGPLTDPGGLVFNRIGEPALFSQDEPMGPYLYDREGYWWTDLIDSGIYRCQWHRIVLDFTAPLPPGSEVTVYTFSGDEKTTALPMPSSNLWMECGRFLGNIQPGSSSAAIESQDVLVQSREGRYLAVMIKMKGSGYTTPRIRTLRIHYPRVSYLNYLPAIYSADDQSRWFLERFLSIFQTEWDELETQIDHTTALFDPAAVPASFLEQLAGWLGLPLEGSWHMEQKRVLLEAASGFTPIRGTKEGLRQYLLAYLKNLSGAEVEKIPVFPQLLEGFRERQQVILAGEKGPRLNRQVLLWGPSQVGRLQLNVYAREGEVRLVSTGDPERDLFHEYANRFRVYVPSAWVRTAQAETMLRRAIEAEKPAHTAYDLCLVEPRLQVGIQAMVGLNTIIGQIPILRLPCAAEIADAPPSRAPRGRLGYDTILGGSPTPAGSIYQIAN
jgi:phage tail-like protein